MSHLSAPARLGALLAGASLIALAASPALAQSASAASPQEGASEDVIVVKATRTTLSSFDYPGVVSVITLDDLEAERPYDLADLLEDVPGLEVSGGPRRTGQTLTLRGLSRENIALLVNGARQNFSSAHDGALFLDPALLGRVETVRGGASSLYGSGAAGGVVAFETLNADDLMSDDERLAARLSAGYRSANEETRGAAALAGRSDRISAAAGLSVRQSGDIELGSGDTLPAEDEIFAGFASARIELSQAVSLDASWIGFRNDVLEPNNGQGDAGVDSLNPLVDKAVESDSLQATLGIDPASRLVDLDLTAYHNIGAVDEFDPLIDRSLQRDLTTTGLRVENRAVFDLGPQETALVTGAEWYEDEQDGFDSADPSGVRGGAPDGSTTFYGVYAQLETRVDTGPLGELILVPGVRWDRFESDSPLSDASQDEALSPRVAATWRLTEEFNLFASWSEAFRAPSLNELYLNGTHFSLPHPILGAPNFITNRFIANPSLQPEETETIEIGAGWQRTGLFTANDHFEVKGAWYQTEAQDLINLSVNFAFNPTCFAPPFAPCSAGTTVSDNVADATLKGFEIMARYDNGPLRLTGALYDVDGEDNATGEPLGALQPTGGYLDALWRFDAQRLDLGARVVFADDFDKTSDPAAHRDGYAVLDVRGSWQPLADRRVRLDVGVENVFDEEYERVFAGVAEAGRSLRVDLTWTGAW
ncbi:TonB-dependent receptor domain-containing protein [Marinicauda pacifica]|uniref:TonB-dependent receptor domain-containing protein n=1 Tax=Marinicauda pacifica TaxID=1133559 RepID=UPI0035C854F5